MDAEKLHLLMNYYPAIFMTAGTALLAAGLLAGKGGLTRFALWLIAGVALLTLVVVMTGEAAGWNEAAAEGTERFAAIHSHKVAATAATAAAALTGIASITSLIRGRRDPARAKKVTAVAFLLAVAASILLTNTVLKGREMRASSSIFNKQQIKVEKTIWHV